MRELSSAWTFLYKFVFPTFWIGAFALGTLLLFVVPDSFEADAEVREIRWIFAGATVVGSTVIYWACMRLKKVSLDANVLVVSNFRRPTDLGSKVVFMPKLRFSLGFSRHPLVAELRALIASPTTHA